MNVNRLPLRSRRTAPGRRALTVLLAGLGLIVPATRATSSAASASLAVHEVRASACGSGYVVQLLPLMN